MGKIDSDELFIVTPWRVGATRDYYGFIPLGAPKAICILEGELINVKNNKILWRYKTEISSSIDGPWDQPPLYPNFTAALRRAIKFSKEDIIDNFLN